MPEKKDKAYPSQFDKVKEITDKLEAGIQALFESEAFKQYDPDRHAEAGCHLGCRIHCLAEELRQAGTEGRDRDPDPCSDAL